MAVTWLSSSRAIRIRFNDSFVVLSSLKKALEDDYVSNACSGGSRKETPGCLSRMESRAFYLTGGDFIAFMKSRSGCIREADHCSRQVYRIGK